MNLFETLRQFKTIEPDSSFAEKSKRAILAYPQNIPPMTSPFRSVLQFIETGAAVTLAGFFIILITGVLSDSTSIAPVQYSVIDPAGLHAEAQAIDMQIELAKVAYTEGVTTVAVSGFVASAKPATSSSLTASITAATSSISAVSSSTATSTSISVDQALSQLTN